MSNGYWFLAVLASATFAPDVCLAQGSSGVAATDAFIRLENLETQPRSKLPTPLIAAHPNSGTYPLRVDFVQATFRYYGRHDVPATGILALAGTQYRFRLNCGAVFGEDKAQYQARWLAAGRKIEIVLTSPGESRQTTCTAKTVAALRAP